MEFNDENQIYKYLDKNYYVKDKFFFSYYDNVKRFGYDVNYSLPKIFGLNDEFCEVIFRKWISKKDFSEDELKEAWGDLFQIETFEVSIKETKLRAKWTPELAKDVSSFYPIDAEAELTALLLSELGILNPRA